ncbi:MAG: T9SS type A sorting domain-containing protein [Flavobacteriales bacterium]
MRNTYFLRKALLVLVTLSAFQSVLGQNVLILWDDSPTNTNTVSLKSYLIASGMSVTMSPTSETGFTGSNPSLTSFDAVIHLNGTTYSTDMPTAGQLALVNFVQNDHGLFIGMDWNSWEYISPQNRLQSMVDLILTTRVGYGTTCNFSVASGQSSHPVLSGVSSAFGFLGSFSTGALRSFSTQPSTILMYNNSTTPGVVVRDFGNGHILNLTTAGNYGGDNALSNSQIKLIIKNFISAYHCANVSLTASNVTCNGDADGVITTAVTGGTAPFAYIWSTGSTASGLSNLNAGTYTVTVSDASGCTETQSVTITQPNQLNTSATGSTLTCFGANNGSLASVATGGTAPYTYSWSNGATTSFQSGLSSGTYSLTVTDNHGCTDSTSATIVEPAALIANATVTNVTCAGSLNGQIQASGSGGSSQYTYAWSTGASGSTVTGLAAGTYTVTVTDNNGCADAETVVINNPAPFTAGINSVTNVSCYGALDGGATTTVSGGQPPYSYAWSSGATGATLSLVGSGTYTLTITDSYGCTDTDVANITQPASITAVLNSTAPTCVGNNGSLSAVAGGGQGPYSYVWSSGSNTNIASNLGAGTFTVTVTDNAGCTSSFNETLIQNGSIAVSSTATDVSCNGLTDGTASASASGTGTSFSYSWSNGSSSAVLTGLAAATYTVTVTANDGCTTTSSVDVEEPSALNAAITGVQNSCGGSSAGTATATGAGGTSPYSYAWNTGSTAGVLTGLSSGTYTVTITDANGCTDADNVTIIQSAAVSASIASTSNLTCFNNASGSVTVSATGGATPYSYLWNNGATGSSANALAAGTYTVTVTTNDGCTSTASATLTQPSNISIPALTRVSVSCNGEDDGILTANPSGGTPGYAYQWSNGASTASNNGLSAGTYSVTVTDANGCTSTRARAMNQPAVLMAFTAVTNASCYGGSTGSVVASTTGGNSGMTYNWSNGASTNSITGLSSGTYFVTVTDNKGCSDIGSASVAEPTAVSLGLVGTNVSCNGGSNGQLVATASGGSPGYTYLWSNSASGSTLSGLNAATYTVTATDVNGCTASMSSTILQPSALIASMVSTSNVLCNGGNNGVAIAGGSGGTGAYSYLWNNAVTSSANTSLTSGTYTVTLSDANGCTDQESVTITQPSALTVSISVANGISCFNGANGSMMASAGGGTSTYGYLWSTGASGNTTTGLSAGNYSVTVTDANGCTVQNSSNITQPAALVASITNQNNVSCAGGSDGAILATQVGGTTPYGYLWSNGTTSSANSGLVAGTYTVTITDNNGCVDTEQITVSQPTPLVVSTTSVSNVSCHGGSNGSIDMSVSGGTSPYAYSWNNSANTQDISGMSAGNYTITVTDNNGCSSSVSNTITEPATLTVSTSVTNNVSCFSGSDGAASSSASGGTFPYGYVWTNGSITGLLSNVAAGTYTVTVNDNNGCTTTESVIITQPTQLMVMASADSVLCYGQSNGVANAIGTGGTSPYSFQWSTSSTGQTLSGLSAATYTVTATDDNGCTASTFVTVFEPQVLESSTNQFNVSCFGGSDGVAEVIPVGGTVPYAYSWSNAANSASNGGVIAGQYEVTVTDVNGCTTQDTVTITEPTELIVVVDSSIMPSCHGLSDGSIIATAFGGTSPYAYLWSNSQSNSMSSSLMAGIYTLTATDDHGCEASVSYELAQPDSLIAVIDSAQMVSCYRAQNGFATVSVVGGTMEYTYEWSNGDSLVFADSIDTGFVYVMVTDINGCYYSDSVLITEPDTLDLMLTIENVTCFGGSDGQIQSGVLGGTMPYEYAWNTGEQTSSISSISSGSYTLTITDSLGCVSMLEAEVGYTNELPVVDLGADSVFCDAVDYELHGGSAGTYLWSTGETTETIIVAEAGTYWVGVVDANGCANTDTIEISIHDCLGVADATAFKNSIRLYPNPASDVIYLQSDVNIGLVNVTMTGTNGQLMIQRKLQLNAQTSESLDLTDLAPGVYLMRLKGENLSASQLFVKQ